MASNRAGDDFHDYAPRNEIDMARAIFSTQRATMELVRAEVNAKFCVLGAEVNLEKE